MSSTYAPCPSCHKLNRVSLDEANAKEPICGHCKTALPVHFGLVEVNGAGLKKLIEKSPLPVVTDFWAPWCGPCKAFAPTFQQVAQRYADRAVFVKLNTEAHPAAGDAYKVRGIPTLVVFRDGAEKVRMSGALPLAEFSDWLDSALA
jgi:thioredoxin 2